MNARAEHLESHPQPVVARAEHISLESSPDVVATPLRHPHRKTLSSFKLNSRLRGSTTEVSLLDDHYLSVRNQLSGEEPSKYVLDLRFANPRPVIVRRVAWVCLGLTLALLLGSAGALWWAASSAATLWTHPGFFAGVAGILAGAAGAFFFLRRTTESLQFTSVHGEATLVNITGGIGSAKAGRKFFVDVIRSISAAKLARPQSKQLFLRDEMREHHRLRELNVLGQEEYEASKARILRAHS